MASPAEHMVERPLLKPDDLELGGNDHEVGEEEEQGRVKTNMLWVNKRRSSKDQRQKDTAKGYKKARDYKEAYGWPRWIFSREYLKLLKSPSFLFFTFLFGIYARCSAVADVYTDFDQVIQFFVGIDKPRCLSSNNSIGCKKRRPTASVTFNKSQATSSFLPKEPFWWAITLLAIYLPVLQCVLQHPIEQLLSKYWIWFHRCSLKTEKQDQRLHSCMYKRDGTTVKPIIAFLLKLLLFPFLPLFISVRQFRQIVLELKLEWYTQNIENAISGPMTLKEKLKGKVMNFIKKCFTRCFCSGDESINTEDDDNEKLASVIREAMKNKDYKPSESAKLYDELTLLSEDRFDEAVLEATPQAMLNLALIFQYGGLLHHQLSLFFSFSSLVSSASGYTINKLKKNPVKRELNILGKGLAFFSKFPAVLSRCVGLSILFSIQTLNAKIMGVLFLTISTLFGMKFEYNNLIDIGPSYIQLILHLLIRGYTSVFTLMEYRVKRFHKGHWEDEADDEAKEGIYEEPKGRWRHQIIYLIISSIVNMAFIFWWYFFTCEHICFVESTGFIQIFLPDVPEPRFFLLLVVSIGAPLSLFFTSIMHIGMVKRATTELGLKAIAALHFHVTSVLKSGNPENIRKLKETLKMVSEHELENITKVEDPAENKSILFHALNHHDNNTLKLETFTELKSLGFPIKNDCLQALSDFTARLFKNKEYYLIKKFLPNLVMEVTGTIPSERGERHSFITKAFQDAKSSHDEEALNIFNECKLLPLSLYPNPKVDNLEPWEGVRVGVAVQWKTNIYIWGGWILRSLLQYNVMERTMSMKQTTGSIPSERYGSAGTLVHNKLYIFGGLDDDSRENMKDLYLLDLTSLVWEEVQYKSEVVPPPRRDHCMWTLGDDIWMFGGYDGHVYYNDLFVFYTTKNVWETMKPTGHIPTGRRNMAHCVNNNNNDVYVFGGFAGGDGLRNDLFRLSKEPLQWTNIKYGGIGTMRGVRDATITCYHEILFLVGGYDGFEMSRTVEVFDISAEECSYSNTTLLTLPNLLNGTQEVIEKYGLRRHHTFGSSQSRLLIMGGLWGNIDHAELNRHFVECELSHLL